MQILIITLDYNLQSFSGLTLSGHVMLMMTNFILLAVGYDILPVEFIRFPLHLRDDVIAQRDVAWQLRNVDDPDHVTRITVNTVGPTWIRGYAIDHMLLYYTRSGGKGHENVFDRDVLLQMK